MAVMTSDYTNGVALEQKAQPLPSSDKMTMDLDTNGTSTTVETSMETTKPESTTITRTAEPSDPEGEVTNVAEIKTIVNGNSAPAPAIHAPAVEAALPDSTVAEHNNAAVLNNNSIVDVSDPSLPTHSNEKAVDQIIEQAADVIDTVNAAKEAPLDGNVVPDEALRPAEVVETVMETLQPSEEQLGEELATELPGVTAVPPIVEAVESDMRGEAVPMVEEVAQPETQESQKVDEQSEVVADKQDAMDIEPTECDVKAAPASLDDLSSTVAEKEQPLHPVDVADLNLNATSQDASAKVEDHEDAVMADAPTADSTASSTKVARERDEDMEDAPAAKRSKVEAEDEKVSEATAEAPLSATEVAVDSADKTKLAPNQLKQLLKTLKGLKQSNAGKPFRTPVVENFPTIAQAYLERVKNPVDLSIIEKKLKDGTYLFLQDVTADIELLVQNCITFNGPEHDISKLAVTVRDTFLSKIPEPVFGEPAKPEKSAKRATPTGDMPSRTNSARRQSRVVTTSTPTSQTPSQTFALAPGGTPLIRRDSTKHEGGRPKREIHPPKSKDLIYHSKPKKKKFAIELKFCEEILQDLTKVPKNSGFNWPFLEPVDPVALNIPTYFNVVKNPMDLSTVARKLQVGEYEQAQDFASDINLMLDNCAKFNPPDNPVSFAEKEFRSYFKGAWSKKDKWVHDHAPASAAASPTSAAGSDGESEEEEEEDDDVEEEMPSNTATVAAQRLIEEQNKLIDLMSAKKQEPALVKMQQELVAIVQRQVNAETLAASAAAKKAKKPKVSKKTKKAAAPKKKSETKKTGPKSRYIGTSEKEVISAGIQQLEGNKIEQAINLIKADMPDLDLDSGEVELDIDQVSQSTLQKLYDLILRVNPSLAPAKPEPVASARSRPAATKSKKHKPMTSSEQEQKIQHLKNLEKQFAPGGKKANNAQAQSRVVPTVEEDESSGDEDSSDSEED